MWCQLLVCRKSYTQVDYNSCHTAKQISGLALFSSLDKLYLSLLVLLQHVTLRLQSKPYMDQYIWETILRKTDWVTCLELDHVSIAKELLPAEKEAQALLQRAVANGNIRLVSRMLQTFLGFPDMDAAAQADQFAMLRFLDSLDKSGTCICRATRKMGVYAAENCNQPMLQWLINNRLEVDGTGVFEAVVGTGSMALIHWVLEQAQQGSIARINGTEGIPALFKALRIGRMDIAVFLIDLFSLRPNVCLNACHVASLADLKQILHAYYKYMAEDSWFWALVILVKRGSIPMVSALLEFVQGIGLSCFSVGPKEALLDISAEHCSLSVSEFLYDQIPDELRASNVTDLAMAAAAGNGDLNLVNLSSSLSSVIKAYHASIVWRNTQCSLQCSHFRLPMYCQNQLEASQEFCCILMYRSFNDINICFKSQRAECGMCTIQLLLMPLFTYNRSLDAHHWDLL